MRLVGVTSSDGFGERSEWELQSVDNVGVVIADDECAEYGSAYGCDTKEDVGDRWQ